MWYRRPTGFDFGPDMPEPERLFARTEAMQGIGGILRATDCLWVNRPDIDAIGELKPYQLELASGSGSACRGRCSPTIPQEVAGAARAGRYGPIVYKSFIGGVIHYPGAFPGGLLTTVVGDEIHEHLDRVGHTMCMFQEYVEKAYEVRLTVIGNTYFPVIINSQEMDSTKVDWRGEAGEASVLPYGDYQPAARRGRQADPGAVDRAERGVRRGRLHRHARRVSTCSWRSTRPGQFMWMQYDLGLPMLAHGRPAHAGRAVPARRRGV